MNTLRIAIRDPEIARPRCTSGIHNSVVLVYKLLSVKVDANMGVGHKSLVANEYPGTNTRKITHDTLRSHEIDTPLDD